MRALEIIFVFGRVPERGDRTRVPSYWRIDVSMLRGGRAPNPFFLIAAMIDACWFVYLLECRGGRIYTGITPDLDKRMAAHRLGRGAKFTRSHPPERLLAVKCCSGTAEALRLEACVKRLRRSAKQLLAAQWLAEQPIGNSAAIESIAT